MKDVSLRALVARKKHHCVACKYDIEKGELYGRFTSFVMQNHSIHFECYAYDHDGIFLVAVDYKPLWNCDVIIMSIDTMLTAIQEIGLKKGITVPIKCN